MRVRHVLFATLAVLSVVLGPVATPAGHRSGPAGGSTSRDADAHATALHDSDHEAVVAGDNGRTRTPALLGLPLALALATTAGCAFGRRRRSRTTFHRSFIAALRYAVARRGPPLVVFTTS
jgi:hypothetical protein